MATTGALGVAHVLDALHLGKAHPERDHQPPPREAPVVPGGELGRDASHVVGAEPVAQRLFDDLASVERPLDEHGHATPRRDGDGESEDPRPVAQRAEGDEDDSRDQLPEQVVGRELGREPRGREARQRRVLPPDRTQAVESEERPHHAHREECERHVTSLPFRFRLGQLRVKLGRLESQGDAWSD